MTVRFNLRHGLGNGLGHGLNGDERNPVTGPLITSLNTGAALATAMGLSPSTQLPSSLYIYNESASPVLNQIATPTADLDNLSAGYSPLFAQALPYPLLFDVGLKYDGGGGEAQLRCSTPVAENEASAASFALLQIFHLYTADTFGQMAGKKATYGSVGAGYWLGNPVANDPGMSYGDGTTAVVLEAVVSDNEAMPATWYGFLTSVDRASNLVTLWSSYGSATSTSATPLGSISNAGAQRYSPCGVGPGMTYTQALTALWFGTPAEGFSQANLDNIMYHLHLENF